MSKTSIDFLAWSNAKEVFGQDASKCSPHSQVLLASVVIPKQPNDSRSEKHLSIGKRYIIKLSMMLRPLLPKM